MSVQAILALININNLLILYNPNAGIGRQDKLKIYWYNIINVQVVFRIINNIYKKQINIYLFFIVILNKLLNIVILII